MSDRPPALSVEDLIGPLSLNGCGELDYVGSPQTGRDRVSL